MSTPTKNHHILIVEDDQWFADSARRTLTAHGFEAAWTPSAQEAAEMVAEATPDLIVLDIFLGQANGLQLLHELRGYDDTSDIPVIVCSNAAKGMAAREFESYGVLTVLDKTTLTPARLVRAVNEVLLR